MPMVHYRVLNLYSGLTGFYCNEVRVMIHVAWFYETNVCDMG